MIPRIDPLAAPRGVKNACILSIPIWAILCGAAYLITKLVTK